MNEWTEDIECVMETIFLLLLKQHELVKKVFSLIHRIQ
jgi:hypothetical protein